MATPLLARVAITIGNCTMVIVMAIMLQEVIYGKASTRAAITTKLTPIAEPIALTNYLPLGTITKTTILRPAP